MAKILAQALDEESSSAKHKVGDIWEDYHSTLGHRKFYYGQADGACTKGSPSVLKSYGQIGQTDDLLRKGQMPLVPLCDVNDNYYAWFQFEGKVNVAHCSCAGAGTFSTIQTGYELAIFSTYFVKGSGVTSLCVGLVVAETGMDCTSPYSVTNMVIFLKGGMGGPYKGAV